MRADSNMATAGNIAYSDFAGGAWKLTAKCTNGSQWTKTVDWAVC